MNVQKHPATVPDIGDLTGIDHFPYRPFGPAQVLTRLGDAVKPLIQFLRRTAKVKRLVEGKNLFVVL